MEAEAAAYSIGVDQIRVTNETVSADIAERLEISPRNGSSCGHGATLRTVDRSRSPRRTSRRRWRPGLPSRRPAPGPVTSTRDWRRPGASFAHVKEEISARMPTPEERKVLEIGPGVPVITLLRTAFDQSERAVEVCDTVKIAHVHVLEYDIPTD